MLGCSDDLIYAGIKSGEIPALHLGRKVFVKTKELLTLLGEEAA
jgi:excisionase family DNA binding protein